MNIKGWVVLIIPAVGRLQFIIVTEWKQHSCCPGHACSIDWVSPKSSGCREQSNMHKHHSVPLILSWAPVPQTKAVLRYRKMLLYLKADRALSLTPGYADVVTFFHRPDFTLKLSLSSVFPRGSQSTCVHSLRIKSQRGTMPTMHTKWNGTQIKRRNDLPHSRKVSSITEADVAAFHKLAQTQDWHFGQECHRTPSLAVYLWMKTVFPLISRTTTTDSACIDLETLSFWHPLPVYIGLINLTVLGTKKFLKKGRRGKKTLVYNQKVNWFGVFSC